MAPMVCRVLGVGALSLLVGCFSEPADPSESGDTGGTTSTAASSTGRASDTQPTEPGTSVADESGSTSWFGSSTWFGTSTGACFEAQEMVLGRPADVDVVTVIDSSPSMESKAFDIRNLLTDWSDNFPDDQRHRFILMSPVGAQVEFCMPPPLGADVCGDSRFPHFTHLDVDTSTPGTNPLAALTARLNSGVAEVRPASQKHVVVITDGDINTTAVNAVNALRALGPGFAGVRVHSVSGGARPACLPSEGLYEAAEISFGTFTTLCPLEDGAQLLDELTRPLASCIFNLPDSIDADDIEGVTLQAGEMDVLLQQVDTLADCSNESLGAAITSVNGEQSLVLCPAVCATYQDQASPKDMGGVRIDICE